MEGAFTGIGPCPASDEGDFLRLRIHVQNPSLPMMDTDVGGG